MKNINVMENGACGDGITKDTLAIQQCIDAAVRQGGGTVFFPAGQYLSGTLYLGDNIHLELDYGAVLRGSPDSTDYNDDDFCAQNCAEPSENASGAHLIVAVGKKNVGISGGCIDGNSPVWLNTPHPTHPEKYKCEGWRPGQMLFFCECTQVRIHDTELVNAPYWTCFFYGCSHVLANTIRIWNNSRTPNGDGIDIDCCRNVCISNCQIESGDDCITVRADGRRLPQGEDICEQIAVTNCTLSTPCNAFRLGVGNGEIRQCVFSNCIVHNSRTGICIVSKYGQALSGVKIHDISFENILLESDRPLVIASDVRGCQDEPSRPIYNISLRHLNGYGIHSCYIVGNPDCQISRISLSDTLLEYHGGEDILKARRQKGSYGEFGIVTADSALYLQNASDIELDNVRIHWGNLSGPWQSALQAVNVTELTTLNCRFPQPKNHEAKH